MLRICTWNFGSLRGNGREVREELRRMIDVCCWQEATRRAHAARMLGMKGRKYKLCISGKGDGVGGVGVMVKEELCETVVEIRRVCERMLTPL